ncbi:DUF917 family protein [Agromyces binzhouensis]|uniref:DUF917 family protein n=1 Tax=Agromyces binzhouensis TaxID=1817495 RepID=A0A4Q2JNI2_9MICO|nr:DUF917 family protein [Agromyces binzhouensis]RXZ48376.1 DUF917 family protein [Agromyces binzhouensis]
MSRAIRAGDVDALVDGARPFATGVDSSALHVLHDWAAEAVAAGPVPLIDLAECSDDDAYAVISIIGSPTAVAENLPSGSEPARAIAALERATGRRVRGILPLNTAGENAVIALATAAAAGIELVDADGCGRVQPRVEQSLFALAGLPISPAVLVSPFGETTVVDGPSHRVAAMFPKLIAASGGWIYFAGYPMGGRDLRATANPGTIARFLDARPGRPLATVPHRVIARAAITSIEVSASAPTARISVLLREVGGRERMMRADAADEFFHVLGDGALLASAPDEILLVSEEGEVIDPDRCAIGMRVDVVAVEVPDVWREKAS